MIEPEVPGVERFLTAQPSDLIRQGKVYQVPLIAGVCRDEFGGVVVCTWLPLNFLYIFDYCIISSISQLSVILFIAVIEQAQRGNTSIIEDLNANWNRIAPISFYYKTNPRSDEISTALKQYYLNGQPLSLQNMDGLSRVSYRRIQ